MEGNAPGWKIVEVAYCSSSYNSKLFLIFSYMAFSFSYNFTQFSTISLYLHKKEYSK